VIRNGLFFDGSGRKPTQCDVAIDGGKVKSAGPKLPAAGRREIDATGCWVMPGMLDIHTHYDAEIEAIPGLDESVRHGVTTVVMGNCSLSTAVGNKKDILDLFCRVESLPRDVLSKWLGPGEALPWNGVREYYQHLDTVPMGPNVASFIGHSNVRSHVMGMDRSLKVAKGPFHDPHGHARSQLDCHDASGDRPGQRNLDGAFGMSGTPPSYIAPGRIVPYPRRPGGSELAGSVHSI
jgi:N-acyl-D-aspartate/D-glutamate deacylase